VNALLLIAGVLSSVALLWAVLLTLQTHEHRRFVRTALTRPPAKWNKPPGVLICVPCKGLDLGLAENLRCVLRQNYSNFRVRFIVEAADDAACAVIEQLMSDAPVACELLIAGTCTDSGQKVHNLRCATVSAEGGYQRGKRRVLLGRGRASRLSRLRRRAGRRKYHSRLHGWVSASVRSDRVIVDVDPLAAILNRLDSHYSDSPETGLLGLLPEELA
jgi:hypothetical protein